MTNKKLALIPLLMFLAAGASFAQPEQPPVTSLMSKDLTNMPGKEVLMITVEYPPGWSDPVHRHNAQAFIYVLEGSVVMQVKGGKQVTLTPGQTFYEGTDDVHLVGLSPNSAPASSLAFFSSRARAVLVPLSLSRTQRMITS